MKDKKRLENIMKKAEEIFENIEERKIRNENK